MNEKENVELSPLRPSDLKFLKEKNEKAEKETPEVTPEPVIPANIKSAFSYFSDHMKDKVI